VCLFVSSRIERSISYFLIGYIHFSCRTQPQLYLSDQPPSDPPTPFKLINTMPLSQMYFLRGAVLAACTIGIAAGTIGVAAGIKITIDKSKSMKAKAKADKAQDKLFTSHLTHPVHTLGLRVTWRSPYAVAVAVGLAHRTTPKLSGWYDDEECSVTVQEEASKASTPLISTPSDASQEEQKHSPVRRLRPNAPQHIELPPFYRNKWDYANRGFPALIYGEDIAWTPIDTEGEPCHESPILDIAHHHATQVNMAHWAWTLAYNGQSKHEWDDDIPEGADYFFHEAFQAAYCQQKAEEDFAETFTPDEMDAWFARNSEDAQEFQVAREKAIMYWDVFPGQYRKYFGKKWAGWYERPAESKMWLGASRTDKVLNLLEISRKTLRPEQVVQTAKLDDGVLFDRAVVKVVVRRRCVPDVGAEEVSQSEVNIRHDSPLEEEHCSLFSAFAVDATHVIPHPPAPPSFDYDARKMAQNNFELLRLLDAQPTLPPAPGFPSFDAFQIAEDQFAKWTVGHLFHAPPPRYILDQPVVCPPPGFDVDAYTQARNRIALEQLLVAY
jgi:hypothetical protein